MVTVGALGAALAMPAIRDIDVDTSVLIMRLQQGALAQLDNARRTAYGYDERISVMGSLGMLASESRRCAVRPLSGAAHPPAGTVCGLVQPGTGDLLQPSRCVCAPSGRRESGWSAGAD